MTAVHVYDKCATPHSYKLVALLKISKLGAFASVDREGRGDETGTRGRSEDITGIPGDLGDRGGRRGDVCEMRRGGGEDRGGCVNLLAFGPLAVFESYRVVQCIEDGIFRFSRVLPGC